MTQTNKDNSKGNIGRNILDKFKSNGSFNTKNSYVQNSNRSTNSNANKVNSLDDDNKRNSNRIKKNTATSTKNISDRTPKNSPTGFKNKNSSNPNSNDDTITIPYSSVIKLTNWVKHNGYGTYKYLYLVFKANGTLGIHSDRAKCEGSIILGNVEDFPTLVSCFKGHFNPRVDVPKLHKDLNTKLQSILIKTKYKVVPKGMAENVKRLNTNDSKTSQNSKSNFTPRSNGKPIIAKKPIDDEYDKIDDNVYQLKKGRVNSGVVKTTANQHKLHYTQMTAEELKYLGNYLNTVKKVNKSYHLKQKIESGEVSLDMKIIYKNFQDPSNYQGIIEYNETFDKKHKRWTQRVILRCKDQEHVIMGGKIQLCNQCVVYDITQNMIITTYYNRVYDNHRGLHNDRYDLTHISPITPGGLKQSSINNKAIRA